MAQDELGHARSTYPVLKALGVEAGDEGLAGRGHRLALLDDELPDWMAFIAANLLIDGVLTTFVASCVDSSVTPMAQRAKKILQEEGSHRVHAEAWARRLCRAGGGQRDALVARLLETWEHAGRWMGPDDDPGVAAALAEGMIARGPAAQREQVRAWLVALLDAEGVTIALAEPTDWSRWDAATRRRRERPTCPFCAAGAVERVGQWGGQIITAQWRCQACNSTSRPCARTSTTREEPRAV